MTSVCANSIFTLTGSITGGASKGIWTTSGSGTFSPSDTSLNGTYMPSTNDAIAGNVMIKLTATNSCNIVADSFNLKITPAPIVDAGLAISVCANNANATLNGTVTNAGGGIWTGGNGNFNPNNTVLNATYTPTSSEISSGSVKTIFNQY